MSKRINQRKAGVILSYIQTVAGALIGLIYVPLLVYFLGKNEYGLYQLMGSILVYLGLFDFGLSNTVTRYYSKYLSLNDSKSQENLLALSTVLYMILGVALLIFGSILYFYLEDIFGASLTESEISTAKTMYIIILISAFLTISTAVFNSIITAHERFIFLRGLSIVQILIRPVLVLAVFLIEASALMVVIVQAAINIFGMALKIYYSFAKLKVNIKFHFWDKPLLKEMVRYSFFIFLTAVMDQIFWRSDQIVLGIIVGTASVAIYSVGTQLVIYYMNLSTAMSGVFLPHITKRVTRNASDDEITGIFIKVGRLQYILLAAVLTGFILFGKEFISLWVGEEFSAAYYITLMIMIPFTVDLIQNIGLAVLQAKNMYSFRAVLFAIMAILKIAVSIPLAYFYGGIGAAFATGISYLIGNGLVMNIYYYKKARLNIFVFWKEILKLSVPVVIVFAIGTLISHISFEPVMISFLLKLLLFVICYIVFLWKLGLNEYEKELISGLLKKVFKIKQVRSQL